MTITSEGDPPLGSGWPARLSIVFQNRKGRGTLLRQRERLGPLCVQRPFYPGDGVCHTYLLHPPGGIVGGDELTLDIKVEPLSKALITTPAAAKIYRSTGPWGELTQQLHAQGKAHLEWLPQETLLFGGSRYRSRTTVHLSSEARFCAWEITGLGRPQSGDDYARGELDQRMEIFVDHLPRLIERYRWGSDDPMLYAAWGLAGHRAFGACYFYPADNDDVARARALAFSDTDPLWAATLLDDLLVVRALASQIRSIRYLFERLWRGLRLRVIGCEPCSPRIWRT